MVHKSAYRYYMIHLLPSLRVLDFKRIRLRVSGCGLVGSTLAVNCITDKSYRVISPMTSLSLYAKGHIVHG